MSNPLNNPLKNTNIRRMNTKILVLISFVLVSISGLPLVAEGAGASLYLAPSGGSFSVGSTFSVSIFVDTKGNEINAIEVDLKFPPEILQVTSPTAGQSFISQWLTPPSYSNLAGKISFKGGIPKGIVTSAGLVSTITFRAKSVGMAKVEFLDNSKILLKDGKGTPILTSNFGGIYQILMPLPEGPKIVSNSHPDSEIWYPDSNPTFSWEKEEGVTDFSYSFSQNSQEVPDNISEGDQTFKSYEEISDGIWYFNLRAKKGGSWGKTSHFPVKIDTTPPQKFEPRVDLANLFVYFQTRDVHSGIDHYEISILNISQTPAAAPFFIEAVSPFKIPYNNPGKYVIVLRAYDKAGNFETAESRFQIISPLFSYIEGRGIQIKGILFTFWFIYLILFILVLTIGYLIFYFSITRPGFKKGIKEIKEALEEIKKVEEREKETQALKEKFEEEKGKLEERLK